ncbi:hypothetical protein DCS_00235 [Drechmeria coniospora]|uniref:Uncharacterized protein n=1 Tax=Drechmeria coniospora TaxID=98403 RepID=A0A151GPR2_DRECN|nr:hypothetical protein DCS_00235 [Drechmeria coniospora]KYK59105.1 hypothetical protein DCS_00235 [Drechmeria coniospora]
MGNQASKDGGASSSSSKGTGDASFQSYPSFSRSDTKESSRSFRSLRSKIPGTSAKTDSPRNSAVLPNGDSTADAKGADAASVRSGRSARSSVSRASRSDLPPFRHGSTDMSSSAILESQPPPSPVSANALRGAHQDLSAAQASGEVDHVSDQPPTANASLGAHMQPPGQSILVKRDADADADQKKTAPADAAAAATSDASPAAGNVAMADIKDIDLDDFIKRLLDAGYAAKVTKSVCLKNAEIVAIC